MRAKALSGAGIVLIKESIRQVALIRNLQMKPFAK
jgi:hypothetical protein